MEIVLVPFIAFCMSLLSHLCALRLFPRWGLLDFPERYGLRRPRLPYPTGVIGVATFLLLYPFLEEWSLRAAGVIAAVTVLAVTSFLDDRHPLPPSIRMAVHVLCALVVFLTGTRIYSVTNPLSAWTGQPVIPLDTLPISWPLMSDPSLTGALFTVAWLGLTINALNWFDGIRGQVSTLSTIGFGVIGALSLSARVHDPHLAAIAFTLCGIAAAGLLFDFPPAKVLMGDTGSMFFGLMLGILTIYAGGKVATGFLVLGVPLMDSAIVVLRRVRKGVSPFRANMTNEHLHHRLLALGWTERQIIALTAGLGTAFGVAALFLNTVQKAVAVLLLFVVMLGCWWYSRLRW